jgi:hypothetical protein
MGKLCLEQKNKIIYIDPAAFEDLFSIWRPAASFYRPVF